MSGWGSRSTASYTSRASGCAEAGREDGVTPVRKARSSGARDSLSSGRAYSNRVFTASLAQRELEDCTFRDCGFRNVDLKGARLNASTFRFLRQVEALQEDLWQHRQRSSWAATPES